MYFITFTISVVYWVMYCMAQKAKALLARGDGPTSPGSNSKFGGAKYGAVNEEY